MTVDPLVSLLVGALGASLIGLVGAWIGAAFQSRREHKRWVREQRLEVYRALLAVADNAQEGIMSTTSTAFRKYMSALVVAQSAVVLLGPKAVSDIVGGFHRAAIKKGKSDPRITESAGLVDPKERERIGLEAIDDHNQTRADFTAAAQRALGIKP